MRRPARGVIGVLAALGAAFAIGVQGVSATVLWTMTASPPSAAVGVGTVFTFTATNFDDLLGIKCVTVEMPGALPVGEVWIAGSSTTAAWTAWRSGPHVTAVIDTGDGDEKLRVGDWVSFSVAVVPSAPGVYAPSAVAYSGHDCVTGARGLAAPPAFVISGDVVPEPLPPLPTPAPTAPPVVVVVTPVLPGLPSTPQPPAVAPRPPASQAPAAPASVADAGVLAADADPAPAAPPEPPTGPDRDVPARAPRGGTIASPPPAQTAPAPPSGPVMALATPEDGIAAADVSLGPLGVIDGFGVWAVPGAVVGGPGILVMLWVALQTGVAAAWIPAVRRMRGADDRRSGPGRRTGDWLMP